MVGRAVHFSLSDDEVATLRGLDRKSRIVHLSNVIEPAYFDNHPDRKAESDKAWDAMHRALTNGQLEWAGGRYPLNHLILGGEILSDEDLIMVLKTPQQVADVAAALPSLTREDFHTRFGAIDAKGYGRPLDDQDFEYTWEWFGDVRSFWLHAASEGRHVLFTVSQ